MVFFSTVMFIAGFVVVAARPDREMATDPFHIGIIRIR